MLLLHAHHSNSTCITHRFYPAGVNHILIEQEKSYMVSHGGDFLHMSGESAIVGQCVGTEEITKEQQAHL